LAFASLKTDAALSKSHPFSSKHLAENSRFIPDFSLKDLASVCLVLMSISGGLLELVDGCGQVKAFLFDKSVAGVMNKVSLMMQKPLF